MIMNDKFYSHRHRRYVAIIVFNCFLSNPPTDLGVNCHLKLRINPKEEDAHCSPTRSREGARLTALPPLLSGHKIRNPQLQQLLGSWRIVTRLAPTNCGRRLLPSPRESLLVVASL